MRHSIWLLASAVLLGLQMAAHANPISINFDELAADGIVGNSTGIYAGNHYAGLGILFRTGDLVAGPGGTVILTNPVDSFEVLGGPGQPAISPPNLAIPLGLGLRDILFIFTTPVTSVSLTSDNFSPEAPDVIRLGALRETSTPNQFTVLGFDQKFDNAVAAPLNLLTISLGGASFSYALFQITTESEGFDNLTFAQVPEPSSMALLGMGTLCVISSTVRRWRRKIDNRSR